MKNKFPIILLVLFAFFSVFRIAFSNKIVYLEKKDFAEFEQTIGELKYSLDNREQDNLRSKYLDILFQINDLNVKNAGETSENNTETKNIYDDEKIKSKLLDLNTSLNKFTERYLIDQDVMKEVKPDESKEKTVEDAYLDSYEAPKVIELDKQKQQLQNQQMAMLKEILIPDDYSALEATVKSMNTEQKFLNAQVHQKILSILLKYPDLDAYLILGQLCGRFEIMAYYEMENGVITKKNLKGLKTPNISEAQEKKYKICRLYYLMLSILNTSKAFSYLQTEKKVFWHTQATSKIIKEDT